MINFGTSSFSEPDWIGPFYPKGTKSADFIKYYATVYNTVEVDSSYYAIPSQASIDNWNNKTPEDFIISAKFPKSITHCGKTSKPDPTKVLVIDEVFDETERFLQQMHKLGTRLGPLILQFPYFNKNMFPDREVFYERLNEYLSRLPKEFKFGVEIRNKNWLSTDYSSILKENNVSLIFQDHPWMPMGDELEKYCNPYTSDFVYIRLLGDRYATEALVEKWNKEVIDHCDSLTRWAKSLKSLEVKKIPTFAYINNHYAGYAPGTLKRLQQLYIDL